MLTKRHEIAVKSDSRISCKFKHGYMSYFEADEKACEITNKENLERPLVAYECPHCGWWHIGRSHDEKIKYESQRRNGNIISETKIREILNEVNRVFGGEYFGTYQAKEYIKGTYDEILNRFMYMERIGFLDYKPVNGSRKFCITSKGFKLIGKGDDKVIDVNENEQKVLDYLKTHKDCDKEEIGKLLNRPAGSAYQFMRTMLQDGLVVMGKIRNEETNKLKNVYNLPGTPEPVDGLKTRSMTPPEIKDETVIIHEPEEILNKQPEPIEDNGQLTIGKIMDLVWPQSVAVKCMKPSGLKHQDKETVIAMFKDQKTLLNIFYQLPENLQEDTKILIDSKRTKIQLTIPVEA